MQLSNNFQRYAVNQIWLDDPFCAVCLSNQGCAVHHIYGRKGEYNKSIYNGIMLCIDCHRIADTHNTHHTGDERKIKLLALTIRQIAKSNYKRIHRDTDFLKSIKEDFLKAVELIK